MTDNKNPESDGFQELEAGFDPLSVNLLSVNKSPEKRSAIDKEKSADKVTMKEKLRSVFGNDIRFDEHQSKSARPHHDSDKRDPDLKKQKESLKVAVFGELPPPKTEAVKKEKTGMQDKIQVLGPPAVQPDSQPASPFKDQDKLHKIFKDLVSNSDEFESEKIGATYTDKYCKIQGNFLLGKYMVPTVDLARLSDEHWRE